jgi:hypothetical protein
MSIPWGFYAGATSSLTSLANPDATLTQLLEDPNLTNSLRLPPPTLLDFVSLPEILEGLFDWALTDNFQNFPNSVRNTRQALSLLTSQSKPLQKKIFSQEVAINRLNTFPETQFSSSPQICGHFQRIVESFLQANQGRGMAQLTSLVDFLTTRLSCLALRDLFVGLLTSESSLIMARGAIFSALVDGLAGPNGYFVATAVLAVVRKSGAENLDSPEIVGKLLDACIPGEGYDPLVASTTFQILERIVAQKPEVGAVVAERASSFRLTERPVDCALAFCARLFPGELPGLVSRVFETPGDTFLNAVIVDAFGKLTPEECAVAAAAQGLPERIIGAFETSRANGHVTKLAEILKALDPEPDILQNDQWHAFVDADLKKRVADRDRQFVSPLQVSDSSDGRNLSTDDDDDEDGGPGIPRPFLEADNGSDDEVRPLDSDDDDQEFQLVAPPGNRSPDGGTLKRPLVFTTDDSGSFLTSSETKSSDDEDEFMLRGPSGDRSPDTMKRPLEFTTDDSGTLPLSPVTKFSDDDDVFVLPDRPGDPSSGVGTFNRRLVFTTDDNGALPASSETRIDDNDGVRDFLDSPAVDGESPQRRSPSEDEGNDQGD